MQIIFSSQSYLSSSSDARMPSHSASYLALASVLANPVGEEQEIGLIQKCSEILSNSPHHPNRHIILSNLGRAHLARFKRQAPFLKESTDDIDAAIDALDDAAALWPPDDGIPMKMATMHSLCETWLSRARISMDPDDIYEAHRLAVAARKMATLDYHLPDTALLRYTVGRALLQWFLLICLVDKLVDHDKMDCTFEWLENALSICSPSDTLYTEILGDLAHANHNRFMHFGEHLEDLNKAIELYTTAVDLVHDSTTGKHAISLRMLAGALLSRHKHIEPDHHDDLNRVLEYSRKAIAFLPEGHYLRPAFLRLMAEVYEIRHDKFNTEPYRVDRTEPNYDLQLPDLDMCIKYSREAATTCHPSEGHYLSLLESIREFLLDRYLLKFMLCDIDEVVELNRRIMTLHPVGHPKRKLALMFFGYAVNMRYEREGLRRPEDFYETQKIWDEALNLKRDNDHMAEDSLAGQILDAAMKQLRYETTLAEERGEEGPMSGIPDIDPWTVPMPEIDLSKPFVLESSEDWDRRRNLGVFLL
ncbi:uncharacterized protein STEHIDRAFT_171241 [Stereum hirsutum FP-91666 SS1]|uniref:uncharacterized protein n=1 Tax=Stereum hirsutum (strain FP-91666) TaxID=721885 RepID=UPI000444A77B|nr:uncharacterized protein STEHIDRAFT_171241 [Stereum hirsutum FP-91666 SS1]EIM82260.1 hypothetical protein STEHIDRAFT_171241 [Stereum hirsutum FP-91666 SS1]